MSKTTKTWLEQKRPKKRLDIAQKTLWMMLSRLIRAVDEVYGDEALLKIHDAIKNWDVHDMAIARSGFKLEELTPLKFLIGVVCPADDYAFSVEHRPIITEEPDETKLRYRVIECNVAKYLGQESKKTCQTIVEAVCEGWTRATGGRVKCTQETFLSRGDEACNVFAEDPKRYKCGSSKVGAVHPWVPAGFSIEQKMNILQPSLWGTMAKVLHVIDGAYGSSASKLVYESFRDWPIHKGNISRAGLSPGKVSLTDFVERLVYPNHAIIVSHKKAPELKREGGNRLLYRVSECNAARAMQGEWPKTCSTIIRGILDGWAKAANTRIRIEMASCLSAGDKSCDIYFELRS